MSEKARLRGESGEEESLRVEKTHQGRPFFLSVLSLSRNLSEGQLFTKLK